jgi:hypothetical protein
MKNNFVYTIKKYLKQFEEDLDSPDPWVFLFADIRLESNVVSFIKKLAGTKEYERKESKQLRDIYDSFIEHRTNREPFGAEEFYKDLEKYVKDYSRVVKI